jgi:hypothetical protein
MVESWKFPEYPPNWREISAKVKRRDKYKCRDCGASKVILHAHHIVSLSKGGTNDLENLKAVCEACHSRYHKHMRTSGSRQTRQAVQTSPIAKAAAQWHSAPPTVAAALPDLTSAEKAVPGCLFLIALFLIALSMCLWFRSRTPLPSNNLEGPRSPASTQQKKARSSDEKFVEPVSNGGEYKADGLALVLVTVESKHGHAGGEISGTVVNRRREGKVSSAQITFNLYDKSGAQVGSATASISNLVAGGIWNFQASTPRADFATYKIAELTGSRD